MVFEIRLHATTSQRLNRLVVLLSLSLGTLCIIIHIFHTHQTKTTNSSIPYCCCVMPSLFIWRRRNEKWNNITATSPPPTTTTRNRYPARDFAQCILITFFSKAKYNEQLSWNSHNTTWERYDVSQVINTMYSSIVSIPSHFFSFSTIAALTQDTYVDVSLNVTTIESRYYVCIDNEKFLSHSSSRQKSHSETAITPCA